LEDYVKISSGDWVGQWKYVENFKPRKVTPEVSQLFFDFFLFLEITVKGAQKIPVAERHIWQARDITREMESPKYISHLFYIQRKAGYGKELNKGLFQNLKNSRSKLIPNLGLTMDKYHLGRTFGDKYEIYNLLSSVTPIEFDKGIKSSFLNLVKDIRKVIEDRYEIEALKIKFKGRPNHLSFTKNDLLRNDEGEVVDVVQSFVDQMSINFKKLAKEIKPAQTGRESFLATQRIVYEDLPELVKRMVGSYKAEFIVKLLIDFGFCDIEKYPFGEHVSGFDQYEFEGFELLFDSNIHPTLLENYKKQRKRFASS